MKGKKRNKLFFIAIYFLLFVVVVGCSKENGKEKEARETPKVKMIEEEEYLYEPSSQPLTIEADSVFSLCKEDNRIFMLASKEGEKDSLISCDINGNDMTQTEINLQKGEKAELLSVNSKGEYYLLTSILVKKKEKEQYFINDIKEDGTIINRYKIKTEENDAPFYINRGHAVIMEDGSVIITSNRKIYLFDSKGNYKKSFDFKNEVMGVFLLEDGNCYSYGYDDNEVNIVVKKLDLEQGFSNPITLNDSSQKSHSDIFAGSGTMLYINYGMKVYTCDLAENIIKPLFHWININIDESKVGELLSIDDNSFMAIERTEQGTIRLIIIKRIKKTEAEERKVLTFACVNLDSKVKEKILAFNKEEENYKIEVKDYSGYEDSINTLNLEMISGQIPDILCMNGLPADMYQKKGLLTDLYPLMEGDSEVRKEDFIDSVRIAAERDGKLYFMGSTFSLNALAGSKKLLDKKEYITLQDLKKIYKTMPRDSILIDFMSRQDFPCSVVCDQIENYIDWNTGEVYFNTKEFIDILEFSKNFPDREDIYIGKDKSLRDGTILFKKFPFTQLEMLQEYDKAWNHSGGCLIIGYPTGEKDTRLGMKFQDSVFAITEQCDDKKAAWEFLRQFFTYEYQTQGGNDIFTRLLGIPVRKDALEKRLDYAMAKKSYIEEDGTEIQPINAVKQDGEYEIEIGPLSKKEKKKIYSVIDRIGRISVSYDITADITSQKICEIIEEELGAFFAEDKTAEETAEIIQNRVKLYVNETL